MTLQQRWRAFKFGLQDRKKELAQSPPVAALAAALAALRAQLEPVVALATEIRRRRDSVVDMCVSFLTASFIFSAFGGITVVSQCLPGCSLRATTLRCL